MARLILLLALTVYQSAFAASQAEQLAIDSYRHLESHEALLDGAIRSGDRRDFERFIARPTQQIIERWPRMGDPSFDKFIRCRFALDGFRVYSEDQFKAGGRLNKTSGQSKDYFEQKAECKKVLAKRI